MKKKTIGILLVQSICVLLMLMWSACSQPTDGTETGGETASTVDSGGNQETIVDTPGNEQQVEATAPDSAHPETSQEQGVPEQTNSEQTPTEQGNTERDPKLAPDKAPQPIAITEWRIGTVISNFLGDTIYKAINEGKFAYPALGESMGAKWVARKVDPKGSLGSFPGNAISYAVTKITAAKETYAFARADTIYRLYVNGIWLPGDLYGSGRYRLPIRLKKGENIIVIRVIGGRKAPAFELWSTDHEVYYNDKDLTIPSFVVGHDYEQCVGVPILNMRATPIPDLKAEVLENDYFERTELNYASFGGIVTSQVAFKLKQKKKFEKEKTEVTFKLRLSSAALKWHYEKELKITTLPADGTAYLRTRISNVDRSCQVYGVRPPEKFDPKKKYALVLSLHGAGVNAMGQARAYSSKDWAVVIAPTNRRRFGFDWEVWGRLDGMEALNHAKKAYNADETKVYVTGHSMGGHGTWQFGILFPGLFAVAGPSAGWNSFYSYTGRRRPTGFFARTQASSDTIKYIKNIARRGIYIIHGGNDRNVPTREGRDMYAACQKVTKDVKYHEEPGKGHWWNGPKAKGADCVDWPDLFAFMKARTLDPFELEFDFTTPAPWVSPRHSYVTILSQKDPYKDTNIVSTWKDKKLSLTTTNVRNLKLNGKALQDKGIKEITIDGKKVPINADSVPVGPQDGKTPSVNGPFNQVMYTPFCFVYPDSGSEKYKHYASYLTTNWMFIGNGQACVMPLSKLTADHKKNFNIVYIGIPSDQLKGVPTGFKWNDTAIQMDKSEYKDASIYIAFPENGKLSGAIYATKGQEHLLFGIQPFTSSLVLPDYMILSPRGVAAGGFFDANWKYDPNFKLPKPRP